MVKILFDEQFVKQFGKLDSQLKEKIRRQIAKIAENPQVGKPMRYGRKGTREVYVPPYRLSYLFENDSVTIADLYHKDEQ